MKKPHSELFEALSSTALKGKKCAYKRKYKCWRVYMFDFEKSWAEVIIIEVFYSWEWNS